MHYLTPYNQSAVIRFPLVVRNSVDLAVKATFTPANGDANISKDGGNQANPANNLNIVTGTTWNVTLSATELTAKEIILMVRNNTAVEDQWLTIRTFGNASAFYPADLGVANLAADLRQIVGAAVSGPAQAGILDVNIKNANNAVFNNQVAQFGAAVISFAANSLTAAAINSNAITGAKVGNDVDIRNVNGNVIVGQVGVNAVKAFFNTNSGTNYAASVAGSVVKEIADNAAGTGASADSILNRLNSNLALGNQTFTLTGSVTGNVGNVTGNLGGSVGSVLALANNSIKELSFDQAAGSFKPHGIVDQGRAQNAAANNIQIRAAAGFACNEIVGGLIVITGGTGVGQTRSITSYNGNTQVANVDTWTTTPSGNIDYSVFAGPPAPTALPQVQVADITANALKEFFNVNTTTNYASAVAGSVVKEIADNAAAANLNVNSIINRLNSNLVLGNQTFTLTGSITGSVGSVTANVNTQFVANNGIFAASLNANAITGAKVSNDVDIRNVNGNVSGTVASVINLNAQLIDAAITSRVTGAQVKSNVVAALATDTYAEPGQGTPGATTDLATKIGYMYKLSRNKIVQNSTQLSVYSNNGAAVDHKATVSDDGNNFTRGELATGP